MMQHGIHSTFDTHSALCMDHYECHSWSFNVIQGHSMSFIVITPGHCLARCIYDYLTSHYHCHHRCHCHLMNL